MAEKDLKDALVRKFRDILPAAVVLRHEDQNTAGIPDISITYMSLTIWLEVKLANPAIHSRGLQLFTCTRLGEQGLCFMVIYSTKLKKTIIVNPKPSIIELLEAIENAPDECMAPGFDHEFVVMFIRRICGDYK